MEKSHFFQCISCIKVKDTMANVSGVSARWSPWSGQTFNHTVVHHDPFSVRTCEVNCDVFGFKGHTGTTCFCHSVSRPLYRRGRDKIEVAGIWKAEVTCAMNNVLIKLEKKGKKRKNMDDEDGSEDDGMDSDDPER